jgi:hypothetical protein
MWLAGEDDGRSCRLGRSSWTLPLLRYVLHPPGPAGRNRPGGGNIRRLPSPVAWGGGACALSAHSAKSMATSPVIEVVSTFGPASASLATIHISPPVAKPYLFLIRSVFGLHESPDDARVCFASNSGTSNSSIRSTVQDTQLYVVQPPPLGLCTINMNVVQYSASTADLALLPSVLQRLSPEMPPTIVVVRVYHVVCKPQPPNNAWEMRVRPDNSTSFFLRQETPGLLAISWRDFLMLCHWSHPSLSPRVRSLFLCHSSFSSYSLLEACPANRKTRAIRSPIRSACSH